MTYQIDALHRHFNWIIKWAGHHSWTGNKKKGHELREIIGAATWAFAKFDDAAASEHLRRAYRIARAWDY